MAKADPNKKPRNDRPNQPLSPTGGKRAAPKTAFKKGQKRLPGAGRTKGTPNKITISVKNALTEAFDGLGGVPALIRWGRLNRGDFYKLWARLLPIQITGEGGGPMVVQTKHDLSKLSIEELTTLAKLVDKASIAAAAAGQTVEGGVSVRLRKSDLLPAVIKETADQDSQDGG